MTNTPNLLKLLKEFEACYNLGEPLLEEEKQAVIMRLIDLIDLINPVC